MCDGYLDVCLNEEEGKKEGKIREGEGKQDAAVEEDKKEEEK